MAKQKDRPTPFTYGAVSWGRNPIPGSLADHITNKMTKIKDSPGVRGEGALRVLERFKTANLKGPREQGGNKPFRTVGPERS